MLWTKYRYLMLALTLHAGAIVFAYGSVHLNEFINIDATANRSIVSFSESEQDLAVEPTPVATATPSPNVEQPEPNVEESIEFPNLTVEDTSDVDAPAAETVADMEYQASSPEPEVLAALGGLPAPFRRVSGELNVTKASADTKPEAAHAAKPAEAKSTSGSPAVTTKPKMLSKNWPKAVTKYFTGKVVIRVEVSQFGQAISATVIEGTGKAAWDRELEQSCMTALYTPATTNGQPVQAAHNFRITFKRRR